MDRDLSATAPAATSGAETTGAETTGAETAGAETFLTPASAAAGASAATAARWRVASEAGDAMAAGDCLAAGVVVISPLTAMFRFHGRDDTRDMLLSAFEVISDIRFHTEVGDADNRALFYRARAAGQEIEEAQLLRFDSDGLIRELTLFGRPLPGLTAVMAGIGPKMLRRQGRPGLARLVGLATSPLAAITRLGDRRMVPLADPSRGGRSR
jgi:SnoaL-like domain